MVGMDDALLIAITSVGQFFNKITADVNTQPAEATAIDCLSKIALTSYPRHASIPSFKAVE